MPSAPDDETLLQRKIQSGPGVKKAELFKRVAVILKFVKINPGKTTADIAKALSPELGLTEGTIPSYLREMATSGLLRCEPYDVAGSQWNAWYLAQWFSDVNYQE